MRTTQIPMTDYNNAIMCDPSIWVKVQAEIEAFNPLADLNYNPGYHVDGDVAIVKASGAIMAGIPEMYEAAGVAICPVRLLDTVENALADEDINSVLIDWDSPGGSVTKVDECALRLADLQAQYGKKVYSHTSTLMASAAYYIAAASYSISSTRSANVGSIGVYTAHVDATKAMEGQGILMRIFRSGKFKGAGAYNSTMSDEQVAQMQEHVNDLAQMFYDHVTAYRPYVSGESMQGQCFLGKDALTVNIVDSIVRSAGEAVENLKS